MHREQLSTRRERAAADRRVLAQPRPLHAKAPWAGGRARVRVLTAWTYALRALAAFVLPGHSARRYAWHAYHSLFPGGAGREGCARRPRSSTEEGRTVKVAHRLPDLPDLRAARVRADHRGRAGGRRRGRHRGGHGARVGDAHHRRRVGQRRRAGDPRGRARVARQARAADLEASRRTTSRASCCPTPATTATTAAARTTATPTSRTCSCTTRWCCR